jgi:hypothetical protein
VFAMVIQSPPENAIGATVHLMQGLVPNRPLPLPLPDLRQ